MKIEVRFHSRSGNTKKVADAIAKAAGVTAQDCNIPVSEPADILFLGGAVYGFTLDENMLAFINGLDAGLVKAVAVFGTSAMVKSGNRKIVSLLKKKGIRVFDENFYCRGEFSKTHTGRPNEDDLSQAAEFAKRAISGLNP